MIIGDGMWGTQKELDLFLRASFDVYRLGNILH